MSSAFDVPMVSDFDVPMLSDFDWSEVHTCKSEIIREALCSDAPWRGIDRLPASLVQSVLDEIQSQLDAGGPAWFRRTGIKCLRALSKCHDVLPSSFLLPISQLRKDSDMILTGNLSLAAAQRRCFPDAVPTQLRSLRNTRRYTSSRFPIVPVSSSPSSSSSSLPPAIIIMRTTSPVHLNESAAARQDGCVDVAMDEGLVSTRASPLVRTTAWVSPLKRISQCTSVPAAIEHDQCTSMRAPLLVRTTTICGHGWYDERRSVCEDSQIGVSLRTVAGVDRDNAGLSRARNVSRELRLLFQLSRCKMLNTGAFSLTSFPRQRI
ncbi:hypothetical protein BDZ89DRAFT_1111244 [Hymenopellis radicata]|nr:hypothetical protein BDZ89DRAFT_1111244 [Hymenopellis radicata]